jgi:hypothetical protein
MLRQEQLLTSSTALRYCQRRFASRTTPSTLKGRTPKATANTLADLMSQPIPAEFIAGSATLASDRPASLKPTNPAPPGSSDNDIMRRKASDATLPAPKASKEKANASTPKTEVVPPTTTAADISQRRPVAAKAKSIDDADWIGALPLPAELGGTSANATATPVAKVSKPAAVDNKPPSFESIPLPAELGGHTQNAKQNSSPITVNDTAQRGPTPTPIASSKPLDDMDWIASLPLPAEFGGSGASAKTSSAATKTSKPTSADSEPFSPELIPLPEEFGGSKINFLVGDAFVQSLEAEVVGEVDHAPKGLRSLIDIVRSALPEVHRTNTDLLAAVTKSIYNRFSTNEKYVLSCFDSLRREGAKELASVLLGLSPSTRSNPLPAPVGIGSPAAGEEFYYQEFRQRYSVAAPFATAPWESTEHKETAMRLLFDALVDEYLKFPEMVHSRNEAAWLVQNAPFHSADLIQQVIERRLETELVTKKVETGIRFALALSDISSGDRNGAVPPYAFTTLTYLEALRAKDPSVYYRALALHGLVFIEKAANDYHFSADQLSDPDGSDVLSVSVKSFLHRGSTVTPRQLFDRFGLAVSGDLSPSERKEALELAYSLLPRDLQDCLEKRAQQLTVAPIPPQLARDTLLLSLLRFFDAEAEKVASGRTSSVELDGSWRQRSPKSLLRGLFDKWRSDAAVEVLRREGFLSSLKLAQVYRRALQYEVAVQLSGEREKPEAAPLPAPTAVPTPLATPTPAAPTSKPVDQSITAKGATKDPSPALINEAPAKPVAAPITPKAAPVPIQVPADQISVPVIAEKGKGKGNGPASTSSVLLDASDDPLKHFGMNFHTWTHYLECVNDASTDTHDSSPFASADTNLEELRVLETANVDQLQTGDLLNSVRLVHAAEAAMIHDSDFTGGQLLSHQGNDTAPIVSDATLGDADGIQSTKAPNTDI